MSNQAIFASLLDEAIDGKNAELTERKRFETACWSNFRPLWKALKSMNAELKRRKLGEIKEEESGRRGFDHQISYKLCSPNFQPVPIRFSFWSDPSKVKVKFGVRNDARSCEFSDRQLDELIPAIMKVAANYFGGED